MTDFINFQTLTRSPKPNSCLAAPPDMCPSARTDLTPPVFSCPAPELFDRLVAHIRSQRSWSKLRSDKPSMRLAFIATTALLRFKDDISAEIIAVDKSQSTLAIYSRSRIGYSDLGTNRKRIEKIVRALTTN